MNESDCSESKYPGCIDGTNNWRMGLRMQFATNRNDRKMIARHSLVFVSIRGRSCGVANIMLLSHCGEYLANIKHLYSPEMIRLPRRITENVRPFKWLRMPPNCLRIPANFLRSLRSVCRISRESFANVKTTYECLTIATNALPSIRIYCHAYENNMNYAFLANARNRFLIFATPHERPYEHLRMSADGDHFAIIAN